MAHPAPPRAPRSESDSSPADPFRPIDEATHRIEAARLDLKGIKTLRVLDETRFLSVLERMVEERLQERLFEGRPLPSANGSTRPAPVEPATTVREEYRRRWDEFRRRFEGKLRTIEERVETLSAAPAPSGR